MAEKATLAESFGPLLARWTDSRHFDGVDGVEGAAGDTDILHINEAATFAGLSGRTTPAGWAPPDGAARTDWTGTRADERQVGSKDDDTLNGAGGDDRLIGKGGSDLLIGGSGHDVARGSGGGDTLIGGGGDDKLIGGGGSDDLAGRAGIDDLRGGRGRDQMSGGAGDDKLRDGRGHDISRGGAGDDRFFDGKGNDTFNGGTGDDVFVFDADVGGGNDTIEVRLIDDDQINLLNFGAITFRVVQRSADTYVARVDDRNLTIHFDQGATIADALDLF